MTFTINTMISLDNSIKYISLGSFIMIFLSSLKLTLYYSFFDINIGEYIQLNEYIVQFIYDLYYYLFLIGLNAIVIFYKEMDYKKVEGIVDSKNDIRLKEVNKTALFITFSVLLLGAALSIFYPSLEFSKRFGLLFSIFILGLCSSYFLFSDTKYNIKFSYIITIVFFSLMMFTSITEPLQIKENKPKAEVNLSYNNGKELMSNTNLKYIGKTEKYVFFYDLETLKTIIYSLEGVSKIEINSSRKKG